MTPKITFDHQLLLSAVRTKLGEIRAVCETATAGPWRVLDGMYPRKPSNYDKTYRLYVLGPKDEHGNTPNVAYGLSPHAAMADGNARLIAASRTWLPQLLSGWERRLERIEVNLSAQPGVLDSERMWAGVELSDMAEALGVTADESEGR